jgi:hypothetical protein
MLLILFFERLPAACMGHACSGKDGPKIDFSSDCIANISNNGVGR